jgi:hypothetical protein
MNYSELVSAIQSYTENAFPDTYLANGTVIGPNAQLNRFIEQAEQRIYNTVQFPSLRKNMTGYVSTSVPYLTAPDDYLSTYSLAVIVDGSYEYLLNKDVNFIRQAYPNPTTDVGVPKYYALFGPSVSGSTISNELSFILGPTPDDNYEVELHFYYYPQSIVQSSINALGVIVGGSGYTNGKYYGVPLTGGTGQGAVADIVVTGGAVDEIFIKNSGCLYTVADNLSADATYLGGTATVDFSVPIAQVNNAQGTSWLGDNFDTVLLYGCLVEAYTFMKGETDLIALYDGKYKEAMAMAQRLGDGLERSDAYRSGQARVAPLPQNNGVR